MTVRFKPLKCTFDVSVYGAFGVWSWAALTSRFIARVRVRNCQVRDLKNAWAGAATRSYCYW